MGEGAFGLRLEGELDRRDEGLGHRLLFRLAQGFQEADLGDVRRKEGDPAHGHRDFRTGAVDIGRIGRVAAALRPEKPQTFLGTPRRAPLDTFKPGLNAREEIAFAI